MFTKRKTGKKAVAPVLATLLMIAVAVAMSVIIFMWSQGFLSQTSESTGSQQGSQNQAAQSSISVESTLITASLTAPRVTMIVRNVGAVSVILGSVSITGPGSNANFTGSLLYTWSSTENTGVTESSGTWTVGTSTDTVAEVTLAKGSSVVVVLTGSTAAANDTTIVSGDVLTIKMTTSVGTFAQATYTVP